MYPQDALRFAAGGGTDAENRAALFSFSRSRTTDFAIPDDKFPLHLFSVYGKVKLRHKFHIHSTLGNTLGKSAFSDFTFQVWMKFVSQQNENGIFRASRFAGRIFVFLWLKCAGSFFADAPRSFRRACGNVSGKMP